VKNKFDSELVGANTDETGLAVRVHLITRELNVVMNEFG
jgi:hypothetical protein